jgi:hypothetical protein
MWYYTDTDRLVGITKSIFHDNTVFAFAKDNPDRRILVRQSYKVIEGSKIKLHLSCMFRLKFDDLSFKGHETSQPAVIKKKVDEVLLVAHLKSVLTSKKGKNAARLMPSRFQS